MGLIKRFRSLFQDQRVDISQRFELLREAVAGTMSHFYMARDRETGQIVGLKIAKKDKLQAFEARFKGLNKPSEGEIAIQMNHPRIVKTLEYGMTTEDVPYIVMEFVNGPGLHVMIMDRDERLQGRRHELVRQMAEAIDYVHKKGFIHRDVCPRNFIYDLDTDSIKLIDFGLTLPQREEFMRPGNRTGTPLYMAPEVIRRRRTDHRLDIFALGVSAYQLCTNQLPWPVLETSGQAALAHDTQPPTPIEHYAPRLPKALARAIMKCIQPDPKDRPQTAEEFLHMIRKVDRDEE